MEHVNATRVSDEDEVSGKGAGINLRESKLGGLKDLRHRVSAQTITDKNDNQEGDNFRPVSSWVEVHGGMLKLEIDERVAAKGTEQ